MQGLKQFSIPFKGLNFEIYNYSLEVDKKFFQEFEESPVKNGNLISQLSLERKSDHLILDFFTEGTIQTDCDRCTAKIDLPIASEFSIIVKFDEDEREEEEIIYIAPESHEINVASIIYEQIILSIPLIKVFDCDLLDPLPCNEDILNILDKGDEKEEVINNPLEEAFKNLKITKPS